MFSGYITLLYVLVDMRQHYGFEFLHLHIRNGDVAAKDQPVLAVLLNLISLIAITCRLHEYTELTD